MAASKELQRLHAIGILGGAAVTVLGLGLVTLSAGSVKGLIVGGLGVWVGSLLAGALAAIYGLLSVIANFGTLARWRPGPTILLGISLPVLGIAILKPGSLFNPLLVMVIGLSALNAYLGVKNLADR